MVTKRNLIIGAVAVYLCIMVVGGAAYYYFDQQQKLQQEQLQAEKLREKTPEELEREAQRAREEEIRRQEEAKAKAAAEAKEKKSRELKDSMSAETVGGMTYYRHRWPKKPEPGVYLRPFVIAGNGKCMIAYDVYYYYHISDPLQTAWIKGDHLDIVAGGQTTTIAFDPSKLNKHMASDAEWLTESYSLNANKAVVDAFKRILSVGGGYIVYYKSGGKSRRHELSAVETKRIREIMELYEILAEE
ncbi:hypothetical protein SELR_19660 [Selenomonas ruminantium subsp. lactilytica TAM6421]|uniref:Uncharacterized protein n=1 Tax=Selenomonas ruminantium subsp. lactilytica (strain NBRC 103574 / TAM6421) TaxID=927704 RepID=I0GSD7_SELRL|nr:hypothetical protein SELR_19660 [Selenomonas ruminantium subsp. lactilytica TAM6421]